jgi:lipopolysaccharide transport protein LptA
MFLWATSFGQAIVGESDRLEFREGKIVYEGNVKLSKDEDILFADRVEVFVDDKGKPKKLIAEGKVRYMGGDREAYAEYAEYDLIKDVLILKGNAKLKDSKSLLEADLIIYDRTNNTLEAKSVKRRVRTVYLEEEPP